MPDTILRDPDVLAYRGQDDGTIIAVFNRETAMQRFMTRYRDITMVAERLTETFYSASFQLNSN